MTPFSGKQNSWGWLSVAGGMIEKPNESPRLAAMQRMRAKRAAAKARAAGAGQEEEKSQEDEIKPNKAMRIVLEVQYQNHAPYLKAHPQPPRPSVRENRSFVVAPQPQPPPSNQVFVLAPPPTTNQVFVLAPPPPLPWPTLKRVTMIRRPTHTLQLLPLDNPHYRSTVIGTRRAWVARADGRRMSGWISWSASLDDVVINCECHNLMFNAIGFLNHAGWNGMLIERPLQQIMVENPRSLG